MVRKIFLLGLTFLLLCQAAVEGATAKDSDLPLKDRVKISVEVEDTTNFVELATDLRLRAMLSEKLAEQKIFKVIETDGIAYGEKIFDAKTLGDKATLSNVGELIIFPPTADKNFDANDKIFYENHGVNYVIRCKILGLGVEEQVESYGYRPSIGIGVGIGSRRHSRFGIGTEFELGGTRRRNIYCAAIQMQFINVATGTTLWRSNFVGQAVLHKKPSKGYDDAHDEAYLKALQEVTENVVKRVTDYSQKFLVGKSE